MTYIPTAANTATGAPPWPNPGAAPAVIDFTNKNTGRSAMALTSFEALDQTADGVQQGSAQLAYPILQLSPPVGNAFVRNS